jgi:hypothetical protein
MRAAQRKGIEPMTHFTRIALSSAAAVALLAGASSLSASAAPLGTNLETLKSAAPAATEQVQWRRHRHHHHGRNLALGLGAFGAGVAIGSAIANPGYGYYDAPYGYYEPSYGYAPYGYTNGNQPNSWDDPADFAGK